MISSRIARMVIAGVAVVAAIAGGASVPAQAKAQAKAPSAPTLVRALAEVNPIDASKPLIQLRWRPPTEGPAPTSYKVYVDGVLLETTRNLRANVTALQIGVVYAFSISSVSSAGESSKVTVNRMAVIAPSEPLNVQVVPDDTTLHISWDPPLSTGGGKIRNYVVRTSSFLPGPPPECRTTATSCSLSGLMNGVTYDITVQAENAGAPRIQGTESQPAIGIPNYRPSGPRNFRVIAAGSTTATLAWDAPQHDGGKAIVGYTISLFNNEGYWFPNQAPEYPQINVGADIRQYRLKGLTPGLQYQFGIQAYTRVSSGAMTVNAMHNPLGLPGKPATVTVEGVGNTTVSLSWEDADPNGGVEPTNYRLTATPVGAPAGVHAEEIVCPVKAAQSAPDFECAGAYLWMRLVNGVTYSFTVQAKNKFGWGPTSDYPATATPEGPPPPPVFASTTVNSPTSLTVAWDPSVTAGGPDVGAVTYTVTLDGAPVCRDISTTSCTFTGLVESQDYEVSVMAVNEVFGGDEFSTSTIIVNTNPIQVVTP